MVRCGKRLRLQDFVLPREGQCGGRCFDSEGGVLLDPIYFFEDECYFNLDGFDQEKLEAVQAVPSLKERYSLESVYANITEKIEDDDLRHKKVTQKAIDFLNSRKALTKSVKSAVKKLFQLKKMN